MEHEIATVKSVATILLHPRTIDIWTAGKFPHHISVLRISGKAEGQFQDVVSTVGFISVLAIDTRWQGHFFQIPASLPALLVLRNVLSWKCHRRGTSHKEEMQTFKQRKNFFSLLLPKIVPGEARFQDSWSFCMNRDFERLEGDVDPTHQKANQMPERAEASGSAPRTQRTATWSLPTTSSQCTPKVCV